MIFSKRQGIITWELLKRVKSCHFSVRNVVGQISSSSVSGAGTLYVVSLMMFRSGEFASKLSMGLNVWQILLIPCLSRL